MNIPPEFESRIDVQTDGCWTWNGWCSGFKGGRGRTAPYPCFQRNKKIIKAHRHFFKLATGIHPGENHVHHKCMNTLCVNPDHLELKTQADHVGEHNRTTHAYNLAMKARETCKRGHLWTPENTRITTGGVRHCKTCTNEAMVRWRAVRGMGGHGHANLLKTHCPQGHEYNVENTRYTPSGHRLCRACNRAQYFKHKDRRAADKSARTST